MRKMAPALIGLLATLAALTLLFVPLPYPLRMTRLSGVIDLGHFVLFAALTVCFHWALKRRAWAAFALGAALVVFSEAGQSVVGRTANVNDLLRGLLGCFAALFVLIGLRKPRTAWRVVGALAAVLLLGAWPAVKAIPFALDTWTEYSSFPVLCDFQTRWQGRRWLKSNAVIQTVSSGAPDETGVGEVDFTPNGKGSGMVVLFPLIRDWSGYRGLCCEFSFEGAPLQVSILLRTGQGASTARMHCLDRGFAAGAHQVWVDLSSSQDNQPSRIDLSQVHSLYFIVAGLTGPRTVYLHKVWLTQPQPASASG